MSLKYRIMEKKTIPDWVVKAMTPLDHKRDCMAFCRDFYVAIRVLPNEARLEAYDAIMDYAFQERLPEQGTVGHLAVAMVDGKIDIPDFEQKSDDISNIYNSIIYEKEKRKYKKKKEKELTPEQQQKFEIFWRIYDRKEGKSLCQQIWANLCEEDVDIIIKSVPLYVRWKSDVKYRKMPATYLRQRCWEDAIPTEFLDHQQTQHNGYEPPKDAIY